MPLNCPCSKVHFTLYEFCFSDNRKNTLFLKQNPSYFLHTDEVGEWPRPWGLCGVLEGR